MEILKRQKVGWKDGRFRMHLNQKIAMEVKDVQTENLDSEANGTATFQLYWRYNQKKCSIIAWKD